MARCALGLRAPRPGPQTGLGAGVECVFRSGMMHEFCAAKMGVTGAPSASPRRHQDGETARTEAQTADGARNCLAGFCTITVI